MTSPAPPQQPRCTCHGSLACVHVDNCRPDPGGRDEKRGWNWHCPFADCEGYSATLVVLAEWAPRPVTVTLPLAGLPDCCPGCGEEPVDGEWPVGVNRLLLAVICPACHTAVANVHATAATDPECE